MYYRRAIKLQAFLDMANEKGKCDFLLFQAIELSLVACYCGNRKLVLNFGPGFMHNYHLYEIFYLFIFFMVIDKKVVRYQE